MTVYGDAVSAVRSSMLAIGLVALSIGSAVFLVTYFTTPRIEVVGYVEVARIHHVDADGTLKEELAVPAVVVAGQINSGAFFEVSNGSVDKPVQLRRARIIARVPPRTENVELSTRADSAEEGIKVVSDLVQRMAVTHRKQQQPTLDRLQKRYDSIQSELQEMQKTRRQLEATVAELAKGGSKEGVQNFIVVSLRSQLNKDMRELERVRESVAEAIGLTRDRPTRLIGNVIPYRASILPPLAFAIVATVLAGLLAAAIVAARAYRHGTSGHD